MSIKKHWIDILVIFILTLSAPLFFYKLSQTSLVSWDEAWYADISRHITETGDVFNLIFNGQTFIDKPPGGFWITAAFFKIFGISEFTARLSQAIAGILSLYTIYFLGKKLFNRVVGFASAVGLCSSFWFLYRARSGNLDILLVLFFLLTLYLALESLKDKRYFLPFSLSLGFLTTIKELLPFALLPALFLIFFKNKLHPLKSFLIPLGCILILFGTWITFQYFNDPNLAFSHFVKGTRRSSLSNSFFESFNLYQTYLHNGIGRWFWLGIIGLFIGLISGKKSFYILIIFLLSYSIPFFFSPEVQLWHLLPLHPILILSFFGSSYLLMNKLLLQLKIAGMPQNLMIALVLLSFTFYLSFTQIKAAWYQFIDIPAYVSDEAILSREAGKYPEQFFIDGDFSPSATFYAHKPVTKVVEPKLNDFFIKEKSFLLITNQWRLDDVKVDSSTYSVLKKDRDKVLIRKK